MSNRPESVILSTFQKITAVFRYGVVVEQTAVLIGGFAVDALAGRAGFCTPYNGAVCGPQVDVFESTWPFATPPAHSRFVGAFGIAVAQGQRPGVTGDDAERIMHSCIFIS